MQPHRHFALAALALGASLTATACASRQVEVVNTDSAAASAVSSMSSMTMTATLTPMGGATVAGTATASHGDAAEFRSTVSITGATASATHPWHVHSGRCGDNGPIVGPASAYPPLQVDANGAATANATVPVAMPSGPLYVNVHLSPTELGTIVACGNLAMK